MNAQETGSVSKEPSASVVIPTTGRWSLNYVLDCVLAQTVALDVVVVDDSLDRSGAKALDTWIASEKPSRHAWRSVSSCGKGLSAARNLGMLTARHDVISLLDDDDIICPHHVERLTSLIHNRHRSFLCAATAIITITAESEIHISETGFGWDDLPGKLRVTNVIPPSSVAFDRASAVTFDTELHVQEDWDAWLRLLTEGVEPVLSPYCTCGYVKDLRSSTAMTVVAGQKASALALFVEGNHRLLERHAPRPSPQIAEQRAAWRRVLADWLAELERGESLDPDYYEAGLMRLFGKPARQYCCSADLQAPIRRRMAPKR